MVWRLGMGLGKPLGLEPVRRYSRRYSRKRRRMYGRMHRRKRGAINATVVVVGVPGCAELVEHQQQQDQPASQAMRRACRRGAQGSQGTGTRRTHVDGGARNRPANYSPHRRGPSWTLAPSAGAGSCGGAAFALSLGSRPASNDDREIPQRHSSSPPIGERQPQTVDPAQPGQRRGDLAQAQPGQLAADAFGQGRQHEETKTVGNGQQGWPCW